MTPPVGRTLLLLALVCLPWTSEAGPKDPHVYKWTDDKGVVHYGDDVPPQYSDQDQTVLNSRGIAVGAVKGKRTAEQLASEAAAREAEERARRDVANARQRDQILLATYLSVEEIESLRDRRSEILDGQTRAIGQYIDQLRVRQNELEGQVQHFKPYSSARNAPVLPAGLAADLVRTTNDIALQTRTLKAKRRELQAMQQNFADDIARFRELKRAGSRGG
jgi:Domain of unknown function (DUF4124)